MLTTGARPAHSPVSVNASDTTRSGHSRSTVGAQSTKCELALSLFPGTIIFAKNSEQIQEKLKSSLLTFEPGTICI
jgi:hypothetical protein